MGHSINPNTSPTPKPHYENDLHVGSSWFMEKGSCIRMTKLNVMLLCTFVTKKETKFDRRLFCAPGCKYMQNASICSLRVVYIHANISVRSGPQHNIVSTALLDPIFSPMFRTTCHRTTKSSTQTCAQPAPHAACALQTLNRVQPCDASRALFKASNSDVAGNFRRIMPCHVSQTAAS